ncbi:MAG: GIY-YIG nuclease family protein [Cyclobacteriaceae bacterium]|nr:GIY-YIG nuclease family protein [Cyclobacteriaceae bacterium]
MSFFIYILQSEIDGSFYIGQTNNLDDRLKRHNAGLERYSRTKRPWKIFWSSQVESRAEAMKLERKLKNFKSRKRIIEFVLKATSR